MPSTRSVARAAAPWLGAGTCLWALAFTAVTFLTGRLDGGLSLLPEGSSPTLILLRLAAILLIPAGGVIALALTQPWGASFPRPLLLTVVGTGAALALAQAAYGVFGGEPSALAQWAWFLVMGLLFLATALVSRFTDRD
ncbi:hypothetical protein JOF53_002457 [Crossiella equi]|uniref:Uncharacterized protein n=2 Tax=Crossiella equi TaxID=130796 RepID=A0ABS5AAH6_9PSEU|nr:hypothetical protein [Crossiella equi]MBP2473585.1 hypothetical protein [Crossiella equi]